MNEDQKIFSIKGSCKDMNKEMSKSRTMIKTKTVLNKAPIKDTRG